MKHLLLTASALLLFLFSFAGLNVTGSLTNLDTVKIGDNTSYIRITIIQNADGKSIDVLSDVYKSKASYTNGKQQLPQVTQIQRTYTINEDTIASCPTSGLAALPGKSLLDKYMYWIHQKIANQILFTNPTFTVSIVDIKL